MSNIPLAREKIAALSFSMVHGLVDEDDILDELDEILALLWRKAPVRRAAATSSKMTAEMAEAIRAFAKRNEDVSLQQIAIRFGVNAGRVSEALHGERW
jgi:hypothetical protein